MITATVNRWHNNADPRLRNCGDNIDAHQARVEGLVKSLCEYLGAPASPDLLYAARHHDEAERVLGDMPGPVKAQYPELAAVYERLERKILADMGIVFTLTDSEARMLKFCDRLDAYHVARSVSAHEADEWRAALNCLWRDTPTRKIMYQALKRRLSPAQIRGETSDIGALEVI